MDPILRFEEPHLELEDSYRDLVREFVEAGEPRIPFPLTFPNEDFPAFLAHLAACSRGEGLKPGVVPHTTYWLNVDGVVVGVSNLRHLLTDRLRRDGGNIGFAVRPSARCWGYARELLRCTLERARCMGVTAIPGWVHEGNLERARAQNPNPSFREASIVEFNEGIARDADIHRRWGHMR